MRRSSWVLRQGFTNVVNQQKKKVAAAAKIAAVDKVFDDEALQEMMLHSPSKGSKVLLHSCCAPCSGAMVSHKVHAQSTIRSVCTRETGTGHV